MQATSAKTWLENAYLHVHRILQVLVRALQGLEISSAEHDKSSGTFGAYSAGGIDTVSPDKLCEVIRVATGACRHPVIHTDHSL